jgi:hypothetical protein
LVDCVFLKEYNVLSWSFSKISAILEETNSQKSDERKEDTMKLAGKAVTALLLAALMIVMLPVSAFAAEDGKVWLTVSEEEGKTAALIVADTQVTDGLVVVTYDSEALTYVGVKTVEAYVAKYAVNAEEPGVVKISWVAPGPYEVDGEAFAMIGVLFEGVEEESTMIINGIAHDDVGNDVIVGEGVDKAELEKAISDAKAVNKDKYTDESVAAMEKALADAEAVFADPLATQEQVDAAAEALRNAINALKAIETVSPGTGDNGVALFGVLAMISVLGMGVLVQNKRRVAR